jgi:aminoglycoside phosphotransferase (APT) family kinase protein
MTSPELNPATLPKGTAAFISDRLHTDQFEVRVNEQQGYMSQAYAVTTEDGNYILRHGRDWRGMQKDAYAAGHFASPLVPVPQVLGLARLDDKSALCLSERLPGSAPYEEQLSLPGTPFNTALNQTLQAIHTADVSASRGYGYGKANGNGLLPRPLFTLGVQRTLFSAVLTRQTALYSSIEETSLLDIMAIKRQLGKACITERRLCHGDLKSDNLLASRGKMTGVLDWARFEYNDPAHDLGILHVRYPGAVDAEAHARAIKLTARGLRERVLYYAMTECLVAIAFFGAKEHSDELAKADQRLIGLAAEAETA